ncbi:MAG: repeat containing protein [Verrucomicrobiales bacterium]|nr:repeat containing protein [Verrucomicrobiales bacterium]
MKATNYKVVALIFALLLFEKSTLAQTTNYTPYVFSSFAGQAEISTVDGTNTDARFYFPQGAALDASGNLYVTEASTVRKITPVGAVTTIAGVPGFFGTNDGPVTAARFNTPNGVVIDSSNNLFVADSLNNTIRKIDTNHVVTTVAGQPLSSPFFRNGTGTNAHFWSPMGLAIDPANNIYVADQNNHCIRMITPNGTVTTAAGTPSSAGSTDGAPLGSKFNAPAGIAVRFNFMFIADTGNHTIRVMAADGSSALRIVAGVAGVPGSSDGFGSAAHFRSPYALAIDQNTNVFVADYGNKLIRKITPAAVVTTIAGSAGVSGALDGPTNNALFNFPTGIAVNNSGTLFIAEYGNCDIRKISSGTVSTWAGLPGVMYSGTNDGVASAARFLGPWGVTAANSGNVYVSDTSNDTIRKVATDGSVTTIAGRAGVQGNSDGTNSTALFRLPYGIAVDAAENIYVADELNATIRKVTPDGVVTTLAGLARSIGSADGTNSTARFSFPTGVGLDSLNNIYVADSGNETIRKVTPDGVVTTIAGKAGFFGSADGTNSTARFNSPWSVVVDTAFSIYVTDRGNATIRKITPGGVVTTFAGLAASGGLVDGVGTNARFSAPTGLAIDKFNNLYVSDSYNLNNTIRKITPDGTVTTLGGVDNGAFGTANGAGRNGCFNQPFAIAIDPNGTLFIADSSNHAIRRAVPFAVALSSQPTTVTLTWPTGSDCLLEHSTALGQNWSPVLDPAETNNSTISVTQPITGQDYYRLRTP